MADYSNVAPPSSNAPGGMNDAFKDALQRARQVHTEIGVSKRDVVVFCFVNARILGPPVNDRPRHQLHAVHRPMLAASRAAASSRIALARLSLIVRPS